MAGLPKQQRQTKRHRMVPGPRSSLDGAAASCAFSRAFIICRRAASLCRRCRPSRSVSVRLPAMAPARRPSAHSIRSMGEHQNDRGAAAIQLLHPPRTSAGKRKSPTDNTSSAMRMSGHGDDGVQACRPPCRRGSLCRTSRKLLQPVLNSPRYSSFLK